MIIEGCSKDPSSVDPGDSARPPIDSVVVFSDSSATYRDSITGNSPTLLVGRFGDVEVRLLLQFPVPSLPTGVDTSDIVSAGIRLIPQYWFRDSSAMLEFTVHNLLREWDEFTVTYDDTTILYELTSSDTFSNVISPRDTITIQIDTALVHEWIRSGQSHGIVLLPTAACSVVYGFTSILDFFTDIRPELIVRYNKRDTTGVIDSVVTRTIQDAFVANASPPPDSQFVYLQAGVADRGFFHFNVDSIPQSSNIMSAELTFTRNPSLSNRNELSQDSIVVHYILDSTNPPRLASSPAPVVAKPGGQDSASVFSANISPIVQQWVTGNPNFGVALRALGEFTTVDKFALYGSEADSTLRPRLKILYSIIR